MNLTQRINGTYMTIQGILSAKIMPIMSNLSTGFDKEMGVFFLKIKS